MSTIEDISRGSEPAAPAPTSPQFDWIRLVPLATVVLILALWSLASSQGWVSKVFLPSPLTVLKSAYQVSVSGFADSTLLEHLLASLGRVFGALAASIVVAVPIGAIIASSRIGRGIFDPIVEFLRPLPPLAYLPLIIIWFGIGEASKVLVIGLAMAPPIIIATAAGVRSVSRDRLNAARSLGATRLQLLRFVVLPSALPSIVTGIRIALGAGWSTLVAAELVAASRGLGFMIQSAATFLGTDVVILGIAVIGIVAILFELLMRALEKRFVPWSNHL